MKKKILILGINGGFGQLLSTQLSKEKQMYLTGIDIDNKAHHLSKYSNYIQSDLTTINYKINLEIKNADILLICLPEDIAYDFFELYKNQIVKTTLLIDILSVKSKVSSIYLKNDFNALSLNPMFGPDLKMKGKNIIIIKFKETDASNSFISILRSWKLNMVFLTADEHDKITSIVQAATHAIIIAFGITLKDFDFSLNDLFKVATPPFLTLSALFSRILSGNKKIYWNIQDENIYASEARQRIVKNLIELDKSIADKKEEDFYRLIQPGTLSQMQDFKKTSDYFSLLFETN